MAKSQKNQTFVLKINTGYLSKHHWHLDVKLDEIRKKSQMVVSLGSSQVLRWLLQIQQRQDDDMIATNIKKHIKELKRKNMSPDIRKEINKEYNMLYKTQFQQDYIMLVMDSAKDYRRACERGFSVTIDYGDGEKPQTVDYVRLIGTAGSIKKSTIMFINKDRHDEIMRRINNGRYTGPCEENEPIKKYKDVELNYKFIPAKLSAYFALQCSASISVPWPRIVVVNDVETTFKSIVRTVRDTGNDTNPSWPSVSDPMLQEITCVANDGMGFISPEMSAIWADSLNEGNEPLSGFNTRCAFLKGMVFTVPFVQFAEEIANTYEIRDAWGDIRDVRDADVIVTTSMLKLWDSYAGFEDYYQNCIKNKYEFCIAKSTPHNLRNVHTTNYQYLQDFHLTDEQIDALIQPTVTKIKECLGLDWKKLILYMCGSNLNEKNVESADPMCKAIMANPGLINDPYIRSKISRMIRKRVNSAKIGVLDVSGDYSIAGNDPYTLLQSIFNLKPTGLLKANECYHKYWIDHNVKEICVFRAPMTTIENVNKLNVVTSQAMEKWYKYINTCIIFNSWDTSAMRCNGEDYDSDSNFCTNNEILLKAFEYKPTLMCIQDKMPKKQPSELDFIDSDINGFGDSIGSVTNKATNMISLREKFDADSEEYKRLTYRISTMMNYQQNAIDRIKGVVARPIPNEWLRVGMHKSSEQDDEETLIDKEINRNIAAEIKPWFFIYRYSQLKTEYNKYEASVRSNCKIRFGKTLDELYASSEKTEEENMFIYNYEKYLPVSMAPGTMNRICWKVEDAFKTMDVMPDVDFDCSILKSDAVYTQDEYDAIKILYEEYGKALLLLSKGRAQNETNSGDVESDTFQLKNEFIKECAIVCKDSKVLSNIVVDMCYVSNKNKAFAWDMVGEQLFVNVLNNSNNTITFPIKDENGCIFFCGERFSLTTKEIGGEEYDNFE